MDGDKRYPTWHLSSIKMSSSWLYHTGSVMLHYCDWLEKKGGAMMAAVMVTVMVVAMTWPPLAVTLGATPW